MVKTYFHSLKKWSLKKKLIFIIAIVFIAFLSVRLVMLIQKSTSKDSKGYGKPPVAVEIEKVTFAPIKDVREYTGTVYPYYQYIVAPKVSGRIIEIRKRIGDWVKNGEIIARIDDAEYQQAVLEAEANLKIAQASLAESKSQFDLTKQESERVQSLYEKGIASSSELDNSLTQYSAQQSRLNLAKAQVEQREASLKSARIRLGYTVLATTEPGFIGERFVDEGSLLAPNSPVVSVIGINRVIVRTTVIERDYGNIKVGQPAEIEVDAFLSKRFYGTVSRIAPMLQEASRVAKMEVEVANDSLLLKPGMFAKVRVVLNEKSSAQVVPSKAIVRRDGKEGVFIVGSDNETARFIQVQIGIVTPEQTEIISPQLEGMVITLGQHLLEEGSIVLLPVSDKKTAPEQYKGEKSQPQGKKQVNEKGGSGSAGETHR
jgi:RND family efflux transporter MFP subunit